MLFYTHSLVPSPLLTTLATCCTVAQGVVDCEHSTLQCCSTVIVYSCVYIIVIDHDKFIVNIVQ